MSLDFDKTNLRDGVLIIQNADDSITCIPEDGATEDEKAMFTEFRQAYPNGKPVSPVKKQAPQPTQDDYLLDLDYRLSKIELGV
ncbi:hypothetical protein [uncultured Clostridium sp.]|uniref:hypothetical protein n=1 Tax=uncultured Clostridium sp. TaxID=59620 RepID=UPI0028E7192B|nr:hypothetical protein [uncultured Clostridium sp.]